MNIVLEQAASLRSLLSVRSQWTKGAYAKAQCDRGGRMFPVGAKNPEAICWCLSGGIQKVCGNGSVFELRKVVHEAALVTGVVNPKHQPISMPCINDVLLQSHAQLLNLLDTAVELAMVPQA